jgi:hypothetical protein
MGAYWWLIALQTGKFVIVPEVLVSRLLTGCRFESSPADRAVGAAAPVWSEADGDPDMKSRGLKSSPVANVWVVPEIAELEARLRRTSNSAAAGTRFALNIPGTSFEKWGAEV